MINLIIQSNTIELPSGATVKVPASWQDYEIFLEKLGDRTSPRLKYSNGELLFMAPLPEHGKQLDILVDLVKVLLRHQGIPFDSYHETTINLPPFSGIIPDHFFYVGQLPVVNQLRIDWTTDPSPDLAIECDVTSFTNIDDYVPYRIGEVWIVRQQKLTIYQLQDNTYLPVERSQFFRDFDLNALFQECIRNAYQFGSVAIDHLSDRYPPRRL